MWNCPDLKGFSVPGSNYCIINRKNPIFSGISLNKCKKFNLSIQLYYFRCNSNIYEKNTLLSPDIPACPGLLEF